MSQKTWLGRRVFVIEDEGLVAMMIEDMLEEIGCELAGTASTLDQALAVASSLEADFVILDLNLGGELAFDVADRLIERGMPLVISTGYGGHALPERLQNVPIVAKPFPRHELEQAIEKALRPRPAP
ncbi:MAG: response regulator [Rhizobiales bacterium]|nr:response regulator [Hyphomicrobiales bacterium]